MPKQNSSSLKKYLREVVSIIVGKHAEEIADLLDKEKHTNEFLIAKKLGITINQTRNILYKIADYGLVSSIRKKDKRKGWYTYFWKIEILKALEFLRAEILKKMDQINNQVKSRETKQFYVCELCNVEFNEENALLRDFTCTECGNVFVIKDNIGLIKELKKQMQKLESDLKMIDFEIGIENSKLEKKREKEEKEKKIERAKKRQEKKKSAEKSKEKDKKSVSKKKIVEKKKISKKSPKKKVGKKSKR